MRIKVDYSLEYKRTGRHNIPGEFAVYTKAGLFEPWVECSTFADYDWSCDEAKRIRKEHGKCPRYF